MVVVASKKKAAEKRPRKTEKLIVWLMPDQIEFLKQDKDGASAAVRAMVSEAMNLQKLALSVKKKSGVRRP
jgi:hypothetical protein